MDAFLGVALVAALVLAGGLGWLALGRARRLQGLQANVAQAETALLEERRSSDEERRVQDLVLRSMEEGVLLLDATGRTVFANEVLARHLGRAPGDVDGLLPIELQRAAKRAGYTGAVTRAEAETGTPSRWLRASASPAGDDGSVLLVVRDVTESRRLEAVRRDFVANASHELKTPVASIQAAAETIRDAAAEDPPAVRRFAEQLERDAVRLSRIVTDLLDLSRLESGSDLQERVRVDEVAEEEVARFADEARAAGVELSIETDGVASVLGSGRDLALLIRNLVDNAISYTKPGGHVDVVVMGGRDETGSGDEVVVRVTDTGVGIPTRDLPRIFERFYRVDRARSRETGGTGLGLAIVKHVTENHGGTVSVRSELDRGSTFEVRLPKAGGS
jgi:signal transduction histidine kinase